MLALRLLVTAFLTAVVAAQHDGVAPASAPAIAAPIDFARDVRPILAQHCYTCHGPDDGKRKAELRLDRKADAFAARDDGAAFVAGKPDESEAMRRILSTDDEDRMPPPKVDVVLKPAEIAVLQRWLAEGAPWSEHWAFVPPVRPPVPTVADTAWPKNEIDHFVRARQAAQELTPNAAAPREAWLRRVTFDLIGLPPTLAELDAFLADKSPDAFEKVVDRLLADERYGERQASEWLDAARYADSSGYQRDTARQAWKWRDWVIEAFNKNMPFDQFTVEQLAGDLLPNATLGQKIATGFNRNHPVNTEAGEELDEYRSAYVIDRVHTTATTFLGLSLGCAQCHDHKYDPLTQKEFYGFYDFFNHVKEKDNGFGRNLKPAIAAPGPDDVPRLADLERRIKTLKRRLDRQDPLADEAQIAWEKTTRERLGAAVAWTTLVPTELMAQHGSRLSRLEDGSVLAGGPTPARDTYELVITPGKRRIEALRLEVLPDSSLPHSSSGRADDGRFILSGLEVRLASVADSSDPPRVAFATVQADVNQQRDEDEHYLTAIEPGAIAEAIVSGSDGPGKGGFRGGSGWSIAGDERKEAREAVLIPIEPLVANETSILRVTLTHNSSDKFKSLVGRFRVSSTDDARIRSFLLPLQPSLWRALGPFPATDVAAAYTTEFAVEKDLTTAAWKKKYDQPIVAPDKGDAKAQEPPAKAEPATTATAQPAPADKPAKEPGKPKLATMLQDLLGLGDGKAPAPTKADEAQPAGDKPDKPKPKRLEWQEQRDWREGDSARLAVEGAASAWFVARKVKCVLPRTMLLELDGGVGAKVWLNGTLVGEYAPAPPAPEPAVKPEAKPEEFDEEAFFSMRGRSSDAEPRRLRLGLRAGDNHLVLKLIAQGAKKPSGKGDAAGGMDLPPGLAAAIEGGAMPPDFAPPRGAGGGLSFRCLLKAEGDDLLDYETLRTLQGRPPAVAPATDAPAAQPVEAAVVAPTADDELPKAKTTTERRTRAVRRWFRTRIDIAGRVLFEELERLQAEKERVESKLPSALVMEELKEPRPTHLFVRGDYRKKGERITATTPAVLPPMPADLPKNRLGLARWLVSGTHPLTARVTVNRYWQQFFGLGLVRTADDFGIRGTAPSHPELLDWLATEFVRTGWNVKQLHRLIVLSATYRQGSAAPAEAWNRDPDNVWLARGPRQRLAAEMVRDQALFVSGLLVQKVGGESVKPFQPEGLWKSMLGSGDWRADPAEKANRRGLYVYWKRGVPYPSFTIFDAAKRETCTVTRTKTTTPLQALVTLNDPVQFEAGRALGRRIHKEGGKDDDARLAFGFRLVTSRSPDAEELTVLKSLLADQKAHYGKNVEAAKQVLGLVAPKPEARGGKRAPNAGKGDTKPAVAMPVPPKKPNEPELPPAEAAAWVQVGCTLLNLEAAIRRG